MSRFGVEKACFDLREPSNEALFCDRRDEFLARYPLSPDERGAIARGDVGTLLTMDVCYGALGELMRVFRYDVETYVTKLRQSAGRMSIWLQPKPITPQVKLVPSVLCFMIYRSALIAGGL